MVCVVIIVAVLAEIRTQGDDKISANPSMVPFILSCDHDSLIPAKESMLP